MSSDRSGQQLPNLDSSITVEELEFYYNQMVTNHLVELEIQTPKAKILLKRSHLEGKANLDLLHYENISVGQKRRKSDTSEVKIESTAPPPIPSHLKVIQSPIHGVFYRSSSPQSLPFAKEGQTINAGSILCIVEAMKVMNEIKADHRCKIIKITAENAKPVNSGQGLFTVELL